MSSYKLKSA
jgi:hypothetical protein